MTNAPTRRGVLRSAAGLAMVPIATDAASGKSSSVKALPAIPRTPEAIRDAFADVPYNENPTDLEQSIAPMRFPEPALRDDGSVPDPQDHVVVEIKPPAWALATAYDKVRHAREQGGDVDRGNVVDHLNDVAYAHEEWVLPDGTDAVDAILTAVEEDHG